MKAFSVLGLLFTGVLTVFLNVALHLRLFYV